MALAPGTRVGPYEVTALLGEGGMGKVWRARHTTLKRDDALKVLPDGFATDSDRLARFQREAQVLASLNHPNIAHVYGLEDVDGVKALVMELVEGPTLDDRIKQGPIPVDDALPIAKQIAEALEAAHEQGIIHRDLKPANIKVRPDGTVKVLDFGLAKAMEPVGPAASNVSQLPTITTPAMTQAGVILGTAAYMSPEQAKGRTIDKRTDVWAFGAVFYEMLTGKRAFDAEDVSETLAAVLRAEVDSTLLPQGVSPALRTFLVRCLQKDPRQRVHDIADVRLALEGAFETPVLAPATPVGVPARAGWRRMVVPMGTLLLGGALASMAVWLVMPPGAPPLVRTEVTTRGGTALTIGPERNIAITPDGSRLIYRGPDGQLLVRALDQLEPLVLTNLRGTRNPFVSPDGQWVGFFDPEGLKRVAITGGPAVTITTLDGPLSGATWGDDGTIVYATGTSATGLQRVSAAGGDPTVLTTPDLGGGEFDHLWPEFLPGGRAVLFTIVSTSGASDDAQIAVLDLATNTQTVLVRGGSHAQYLPTGHLLYSTAGTLRAVAFDLARLAVVGTPVPVVEQVLTSDRGAVNAVVAANGTLVYLEGVWAATQSRQLAWLDRDGRRDVIDAIPIGSFLAPELSPDDSRVMVFNAGDVWVYDLTDGRATRLTADGRGSSSGVWDPTGTLVAYSWARGDNRDVWIAPVDGSEPPRLAADAETDLEVESWSPDGRVLVVHQFKAQAREDLYTLTLDEEPAPEPRPFLVDPFSTHHVTFSPDGRYVAYTSNESGQDEIYIRAFPGPGGRMPVSVGGGSEPRWGQNGELFFRSLARDRMMLASVQTTPALTISAPEELFAEPFAVTGTQDPRNPLYDVTADGQRFLVVDNADTSTGESEVNPTRIIVVQNFFEELQQRVPVD